LYLFSAFTHNTEGLALYAESVQQVAISILKRYAFSEHGTRHTKGVEPIDQSTPQ
jgi:hypothetical protein